MIAINLLPWRDHRRLRQALRNKLITGAGVVLIVLMLAVWYWHSQPSPVVIRVPSPVSVIETLPGELQQIHFVGYVHAEAQIWGLLVLPNGKTEAVQVGTQAAAMQVKSIDEKHLILLLSNHQSYTLKLAGI